MEGNEAMAVVSLLQYADNLQLGLKAALKEDADWYRRFMPLTEVVKYYHRPFRLSRAPYNWMLIRPYFVLTIYADNGIRHKPVIS